MATLKEHSDKILLKKPTKISFRNTGESQNPGNVSHRRRSAASDELNANIVIEDLKLGEQFSVALSKQGVVFTWGQNDMGQLGLGNEISTIEPTPITSFTKQLWKIDCGLKHCLALSKDNVLFAWGSNQQCQLGKRTSQKFSNTPILVTAFENAKPIKIACGSYHNICLSYKLPK